MPKTPDPQVSIEKIEIEAIIAGALMRLTFDGDSNPAAIPDHIRTLDPDATFREKFWTGKNGNRNSLATTAKTILVKSTSSGTFVDLICENGEGVTVRVPKKKIDAFPTDIEALGKLTKANAAKVRTAIDDKKDATIILHDDENFAVHYFAGTDGGTFYLDHLEKDPPPAPAAETKEEK